MLSTFRVRRTSRRVVDFCPRVGRIAVGATTALALSVAAMAATPTFWTVSTQAEFLKGDVTDLSVDSDGRVFPGPSASLLAETAAPFLWTVMTAPDGTLW